ncbi:MAG: hypothetical protein ACLPWS_03120 [Rhodomicrobium sp.]
MKLGVIAALMRRLIVTFNAMVRAGTPWNGVTRHTVDKRLSVFR